MGTALEGLDRAFLPTEWLPILVSLDSDGPFPPSTLGDPLEHRII